jgi:uncharacterized protein (DUF2336 family)
VSTATHASNDNQDSLIEELETAVRSGSSEARVKKLREVTALFLVDAASLTEEQVKVFDDVLCKLTARIETKVLAELGHRLAPVDNAPVETIKQLAWNEAITVAGPVLAASRRLTTSDLAEIAEVRGQAHLVAISKRETLESPVTDVLLKRGEREVIHTLATNAGAQFSESGYANLVEKTEGDEILSEAVGSRGDIPLRLLRDLLARATETVRAKLLALIPAGKREQLAHILSEISNAVAGVTKDGRYENAEKAIRALQAVGSMNDRTICDFARSRQLPEVIVGIALLASAKIDVIKEILTGDRNDAVLVPCKAVNLRWETVEQILRNRQLQKPPSQQIIDLANADYRRLSVETAQKTLRFLQVKAVVK